MSKVMISLPETFLHEVDVVAKSEQRSRSELVREAIRTYVATHTGRRWIPSPAAQRAALRILHTRLKLPTGETAESLVRKIRDARYGH